MLKYNGFAAAYIFVPICAWLVSSYKLAQQSLHFSCIQRLDVDGDLDQTLDR